MSKDTDLCATCHHALAYHESYEITIGHCEACPVEKRCQRFIPRPAGDEKREGEG